MLRAALVYKLFDCGKSKFPGEKKERERGSVWILGEFWTLTYPWSAWERERDLWVIIAPERWDHSLWSPCSCGPFFSFGPHPSDWGWLNVLTFLDKTSKPIHIQALLFFLFCVCTLLLLMFFSYWWAGLANSIIIRLPFSKQKALGFVWLALTL